MNACTHAETDYCAEYVLFVMLRDFLRCRACRAEYSLVYRKWSPAPLSPSNT